MVDQRGHYRHLSGFTLLETILALGLSSFLLVVVFSLVDSTVHYHIAGNDQVLVGQRLLGVLQDLRFDLRSAKSDPQWSQRKSTVSTTDEPQSNLDKFTQQLQLRDLANYAEPIAFLGETNWLLVTLTQSSPRFFSATSPASSPNPQILWTSGAGNTLVVSTHDDHGRRLTTRIADLAPGILWRIELNSTPSTFFAPARHERYAVTAIRSLQFRYFDGQTWQASWDSVAAKSLPRAVEISILPNDSEPRQWTVAIPSESRSHSLHKEAR